MNVIAHHLRNVLSLSLAFAVTTAAGAEPLIAASVLRKSPFLKADALSNGFVDSVVNACRLDVLKKGAAFKATMKRKVRWPFPETPYNLPGKTFSAMLYLQRDERGTVKNADLTVVVPGLFSDDDDLQSKVVASIFFNLGHHVAVLPSPWSPDFIRVANFKMGALGAESAVVLGMVKHLRNSVKSWGSLRRTHLYGFSYGAYLTAYSAMMDARSAQPMVNGRVLLVSPPYDMRDNLAVMDKFLVEHTPVGRSLSIFKLLSMRGKLCSANADAYRGLPEWRAAAGGAIARLIFKDGLDHAVENYEKRADAHDFTSRALPRRERKDFLRQLSFRTYVDNYFPDMFDGFPVTTRITTFIERSEKLRPNRIRVLTSTNDFINPPDAWKRERSADYLVTLGQGGHVGFFYDDWTMGLLPSLLK